MKTTKYFEYTRKRPDRFGIKDEWIEKTIKSPQNHKTFRRQI